MAGDIAFTIFAGILLVIGFAGTIVPVLPGAPLAWIGLLLAYFSSYTDISVTALIITAVIAILVSVLDNIFPIIFTKQSGGSKVGTLGFNNRLNRRIFYRTFRNYSWTFCWCLGRRNDSR